MQPINRAGVDLVKTLEGLRLEAYQDSASVWTIGYGYTRGVMHGMRISREMAEDLLLVALMHAAEGVTRLITAPLTPNQFAALVSFTYNVGAGALATSTLRRILNGRDYAGVPAQLRRWTKATVNGRKVELPGLVRRREAEASLWARK